MISGSIDWGEVIAACIGGLPAFGAWVRAEMIHRQIKLPSGKSIGEAIEYAHDTAIANNLMLRAANGETKPIDQETIKAEGESPPQVPKELP